MDTKRTAASEKAKAFIKLLKKEKNVDYNYLREIFRKIRRNRGGTRIFLSKKTTLQCFERFWRKLKVGFLRTNLRLNFKF